MLRPISAPWLLRFDPTRLEVRLLIAGVDAANVTEAGISLTWREQGSRQEQGSDREQGSDHEQGSDQEQNSHRAQGFQRTRAIEPQGISPTRLGPEVMLACFEVKGYSGNGGHYRINCAAHRTSWITVCPDPLPGEPWRFLLASDHQCQAGVQPTVEAISHAALGEPFHGILFPGDLVDLADDPASWFGAPGGQSFIDSMAAPVRKVFCESASRSGDEGQLSKQAARSAGVAKTTESVFPPGWPVLSTTPIFVCAGNHDISSDRGRNAIERARSVSPQNWDMETFGALFLPKDTPVAPSASELLSACPSSATPSARSSAATPSALSASILDPSATHSLVPPGCYTASIGPLRILSLTVVRRWVPGDHARQTGPCYQLPGRFIFEPITPGSRQLEWARQQIGAAERSVALHVALLHHPPYAQGCNTLPFFDEPLAYETNQIARHLVPVVAPWAHLVLSGHNHAMNHHQIDGVHYYESSHMGPGKAPWAELPDGSPAPEPLGNDSLFFAGEEEATYYSVLEVVEQGQSIRAMIKCHRVHAEGGVEVAYDFRL